MLAQFVAMHLGAPPPLAIGARRRYNYWIHEMNMKRFSITPQKAAGWVSGPFCALAALLALCALSNDAFFQTQNLLNITRQVSYSGIIALGMTFVIVGGGIDLSVGSLFALSGVAAAVSMRAFSAPAAAALGIATDSAGVAIGLAAAMAAAMAGAGVNALLIVAGRLPPFIATLGTYSIFRSAALLLADSGTVQAGNPALERLGGGSILGLPAPAAVMFAFAAALELLLALTVFGRHCCAVGASERVAKYAGVRTGRVRALTYLLPGVCAGAAAFLFLGRLGSVSSSDAGMLYELDAIAAVIIGGAAMSGGSGTLRGTLAGVFILGVLSNILDLWGVPVNLKGVVKGAVIAASVMMQGRGAASAMAGFFSKRK